MNYRTYVQVGRTPATTPHFRYASPNVFNWYNSELEIYRFEYYI